MKRKGIIAVITLVLCIACGALYAWKCSAPKTSTEPTETATEELETSSSPETEEITEISETETELITEPETEETEITVETAEGSDATTPNGLTDNDADQVYENEDQDQQDVVVGDEFEVTLDENQAVGGF